MAKTDTDSRLELRDLIDKFGEKAFPVHSSFYLGELALFSFIGLVTTGIFLAFFYEPSTRVITYQKQSVPAAFASILRINSLTLGLIARRIHHWSAHIMIASLLAHMARVYFTGAYKKPRDINWVIGFIALLLTVMAAFVGYLLPFDEFAVTATGIGYSIISSIPWIGTAIANLAFAGTFPNPFVVPRFYGWHIMLIPLLLAGLIGIHLIILFKLKHTQHHKITQKIRDQANETRKGIVGLPLWPEQTLNMVVIFMAYAAGVSFLAAYVPVHPVEVYGPPVAGTPAIKPDWYLLWVFGILRLTPSVEFVIFGGEITAEFIGGVLIPGIVVILMLLVPFIDHKITGDVPEDPTYEYTDNISDHPARTGIGVSAIIFFFMTSAAGYSQALGIPDKIMLIATVVFIIVGGLVVYFGLKMASSSSKSPSAEMSSSNRGGE
ncbi:MAG: cytochrome bc complex cytochrome b subunit [Halobacteriaceae archaeon]